MVVIVQELMYTRYGMTKEGIMAITESRIKAIEDRLNELTQNFIQTQQNQVPITAKVDYTSNKIEELTPYTETKTAYIDDTEIVFDNVPPGNITILTDPMINFTAKKEDDRLTVSFEPLEEVTEVTLTIH